MLLVSISPATSGICQLVVDVESIYHAALPPLYTGLENCLCGGRCAVTTFSEAHFGRLELHCNICAPPQDK